MSFTSEESLACEQLVRLALQEDLGQRGDLTSLALLPPDLQGQAFFVARAPGVLAGLPAVQIVCRAHDPSLQLEPRLPEGSPLVPGSILAVLCGSMRSILSCERTALNFLQRLSGIASHTARYVATIVGLSCQLLDTRKTTPGWRLLEKYAVRQGGAQNHRLGLHDGVLIKDNHLAALGGTPQAVQSALTLVRQRYGSQFPIEIEVDNLEQLELALVGQPDIILLDNMSPELLRLAVARRNALAPAVLLEASGGITLSNLRTVAETGVDRISIGALTHSAVALDLALDYLPGSA